MMWRWRMMVAQSAAHPCTQPYYILFAGCTLTYAVGLYFQMQCMIIIGAIVVLR